MTMLLVINFIKLDLISPMTPTLSLLTPRLRMDKIAKPYLFDFVQLLIVLDNGQCGLLECVESLSNGLLIVIHSSTRLPSLQ